MSRNPQRDTRIMGCMVLVVLGIPWWIGLFWIMGQVFRIVNGG